MTSVELKRTGYWGYAAGSVLLGGVLLGPLISFYISRLLPVEYPPTYPDILFASLILSILHLASLDHISGKINFPYFIKMLLFINLMALAAYFGGKRVIFLVPGVLLIAVYWVCGEFVLALIRCKADGDREGSQSASAQGHLKSFAVGFAALAGFVIVSSFFVDSEEFFTLDAKPILVRATFHVATTTQEEQRLIHKEMQSRILGLPEVSSVKTRIGVAPSSAVQLSHYYSAELLLEITLYEQWHLKESKKALSSKVIKLIQYPGIEARLVKVIEPLIPELSANTAKELRFKVNQESVRKFNLDELFAKEEIQSLLKHAPASARPQDLMDLNIMKRDGLIIPISTIGDFELAEVLLDSTNLLPGTWQPISKAKGENIGYLVEISLGRLYQYGLTFSEVEQKIKAVFDDSQGSLDQETLNRISLRKVDKNVLRLADVARITLRMGLENADGEGKNKYRVQWSLNRQ